MDRNRAVGGVFWKFIERFSYQIVSFIITILLARLLTPEEYGLVAIVIAIVSILQVFVDSGLGTSLVQKKEISNIDYSTVFIANLVVSLVLYAAMFFAAPWISKFYGEDLTDVIRALSLILVIFAFKNVFTSYITRNMLFNKAFWASLIGFLVGGIIGIIMAYQGYGVWALVAQQLISEALSTVLMLVIVRWAPRIGFSGKSFKANFGYSWKLLCSSLIDSVYNNTRQLLIGKYYSSDDLAYYSKGDQFPNFIVGNINTTMNTVLLPVMSEKQDDKKEVKDVARRVIRTSSYVLWPMMIGLLVMAGNVIDFILTPAWHSVVPYMQIFCLVYVLQPLQTTNLSVMKCLGRTDLCLKLEIIKKSIAFAIIILTLKFGVYVIAFGSLAYAIIATVINSVPNKKLIGYSYFEQIRDVLPFIGTSVAMGVGVYFVGLLPLPLFPLILVQVTVGILLYVALSLLFKIESFYYVWDIVKGFLHRGKKNEDAEE